MIGPRARSLFTSLLLLASLRAFAVDVPPVTAQLHSVIFPERQTTRVDFYGSKAAPAAALSAQVEAAKGQTTVRIEFDGMKPAILFGGDVTAYVVWAVTKDGLTENLGELWVRGPKGEYRMQTGKRDFATMITAEPHPLVEKPSPLVMFRSAPVKEGRVANAEFTFSGFGPKVVTAHESIASLNYRDDDPIDLAQARKAMQLAERMGAQAYNEKAMQQARTTLAQATNLAKTGDRTMSDYARRTVSLASEAMRDMERQTAERQVAAEEAQRQAELASLLSEAERSAKQLEAVRLQRLALQDEIRRVEARSVAAVAELGEVELERAKLAAERDGIVAERDAIRTDRDKQIAERVGLQSERDALQASRDGLRVERDTLTQEKASLAKERDDLVAQKAGLLKERDASRQERDTLTREKALIAEERDKLAREKSTLQQERDAIAAQRDAVAKERDSAAKERDSLAAETEALSREKGALETDRDAIAKERDALATERDGLAKERDNVTQQRDALEQRLSGALAKVADTSKTARGLVVNLSGILFDLNKSSLTADARKTVAKLSGVLLMMPEMNLRVEGHTDSTGSDELNMRLSQERAKGVYDFLLAEGIPEERMKSEGYGSKLPVASNDTKEGRAQNRRVEVVLSEGVISGADVKP